MSAEDRIETALENLPPNAPEAEAGLLGCILLARIPPADMDPLPLIQDRIGTAPAFFDNRCATIWQAMLHLRRSGKHVDEITLFDALRATKLLEEAGGPVFLGELQKHTGNATLWPHYLEIVMQRFAERKMIQLCADHQQRAMNSEASLDGFAREAARLREDHTTRTSDIHGPADNAAGFADDIERRVKNRDTRTGIATGLVDFDEICDGLQLGDLTVLAARPSIGKTAFAITVIEHACLRHAVPTLFITYESSPDALRMRLAACASFIELKSMKRGRLDERDQPALTAFNLRMRGAPLFFLSCVQKRMNAVQLRAATKRICEAHGIKLITMDYLQKVPASRSNEKRTYEVAEVATELKAIAEDNRAAVLALAQVNRESEKSRDGNGNTQPPHLPDIKDSGQIEQEADLVGLLHRQRSTPIGEALLIIAKQRDGETGAIKLHFDGRFCRFSNAATEST